MPDKIILEAIKRAALTLRIPTYMQMFVAAGCFVALSLCDPSGRSILSAFIVGVSLLAMGFLLRFRQRVADRRHEVVPNNLYWSWVGFTMRILGWVALAAELYAVFHRIGTHYYVSDLAGFRFVFSLYAYYLISLHTYPLSASRKLVAIH